MLATAQTKTDRQKAVSMLQLERSSSHSWWWDSHNSPKHSKWLQSNLQDLDDKVKEMLRLIEEDADSFAQRAEMYYKKRPELVNLVEEFYRAYRSLAERYDHLTGEIRQNIPRALQVQYGLSCDSPRSTNAGSGRHHYSPLRRSNQMFESLLKAASKMEDQSKEAANAVGNCTQSLHEKCADIDEGVENGGCDDVPSVDSCHNSSDGGLSSASSDSEVDNLTPLTRLRQEIDELKETNKVLAESQQNVLQLNTALQIKLEDFKESYRRKNDEVDALRSKLNDLNEGLLCTKAGSEQRHSDLSENDVQEREFEIEIIPFLEEENDSSAGEEDAYGSGKKSLEAAATVTHNASIQYKSMQEQRVALLQEQLVLLREENRVQKLVILERAEEKREAIRQLCFSMDNLRSKNR
eukprot:c12486_g1_i1 orf=63-1289(+)